VLEARAPGVAEQVELGWDQLGAGWLPPDVALDQLPTRLAGDDQILELQWSPAGNDGEVMFVATDVTAQLQAEEERREQEELVNILARIGRSRQQVVDFASDARRIVDALIGREGSDAQERRWIHTLKGNAAVMGLGRLASGLHALETTLADEQRPATDAERAALDEHWTRYESRIDEVVGSDDQDTVRVPSAELGEAIDRVAAGEARSRVVARLESWTWDDAHSRMVHLAEQAKRLAHRMDKSIDVTIDAADVRTPPTRAWRELWASLVHLVRNAVDHGLEQDRAAAGKSGSGQLTLRTQRVADTVQIEVLDDGAGIDWAALETKARAHGQSLETDADRTAWLFADGVTSRDEVTEVSGRGVGTSAVRELVDTLGGNIVVESEVGTFTRFTIALPLVAREEAANGTRAARSA
jgi:two-component system chemotaxis sensor kinase CheA